MDILKALADNPALCDALKALLEKQFTLDTIDVDNPVVSNEHIGEQVRARIVGLRKIQGAFDELAKYKTGSAVGKTANPAY